MIWRSVTLISCGIVGGWLGWLASERDVPVKYQASEVLNSPRPGETLRIRHQVWRDKSCATTVYRLVFDKDNDRFIVPDLEFSRGVLPLGADTFVVPVPISPQADPGPAVYRVMREYRCNFLHNIWPIKDGPHDHTFTIAAKPVE
jgi:hypothetical protein